MQLDNSRNHHAAMRPSHHTAVFTYATVPVDGVHDGIEVGETVGHVSYVVLRSHPGISCESLLLPLSEGQNDSGL